jgi:CubicO group peptidase (beta-lactamase class C family)
VSSLRDVASSWCERRGLPGAQLAVAHDGEIVAFEAVGDATTSSRFLIWSCTKAVVAAVVWQLVGEGRVVYDVPVAEYIPQFATNGKDVVTVEHVLLHTAGFPLAPLGPLRWATSESRREAFSRWRLNWEPGSRFEYHQLAGGWVLAEIIEAVEGRDYRTVVDERIARPLGLPSFALGVAEDRQGDIAPVVVCGEPATDDDYIAAGWKPLPPPTVTPHGALMMNTPAALSIGIPGGGAVSTAADVARFYQSLLHDREGLWDPNVLHDATTVIRNRFPDDSRWGEPANRTRGLVVRGLDEPFASLRHHFGPSTSPRTFGHDGAGGQIAWADPESGRSFCFLTNGYDANRVQELLRNQELSRAAAAL